MVERFVYIIAATAPDGSVHRYIGSTAFLKERLTWHRSRHEKRKHKNIPSEYVVDWNAVEVSGPFIGSAEQLAKGEEQRLYEYWFSHGPMLNKMAPRLTTADALIASAGIGGKRTKMAAARAALTPEILAAGRKKSGAISGQRNKESGWMSSIGKKYGAIHGPLHIRKAQAAWMALPKEHRSAISRRNGAIAGRKSVDSGRLASYNLMRTPEERAALAGKAGKARAKFTNAKRWGIEVEPGLWISRKTGAVLLDQR